MFEVVVPSWTAFPAALAKVRAEVAALRDPGFLGDNLLFRGLPDARWHLSTTLERAAGKDFSIQRYHQILNEIKPEVESHTGRTWELMPQPEFEARVGSGDPPSWFMSNLAGYAFMAHLRHNGFPSPLLDWTASPYIAAYFAFRKVARGVDRVAIFAFLDRVGPGKMQDVGSPAISVLELTLSLDFPRYLGHSRASL